jgi:hypothetical protein
MWRFLLIIVCIVIPPACGNADQAANSEPTTATLELTALAGPVCPVETDPPLPECAPRPVEKAEIVVMDAEGMEVGRGTTGADGTVTIEVPAGELTVVPQPVAGLLGTAPEIMVTLSQGQVLQVSADYDTGIR